MDEQGLAASVGAMKPMRDLNEIVQMLMQGMTPDELIQNGVPEELVMAALEEVSKQTTQVPQGQEGLAGMAIQRGPEMR